jgi:hypothetical protein
VSDIDIAVVDSLKALDPKRPIREADIRNAHGNARSGRANMHLLKAIGGIRRSNAYLNPP